MHGMSDGTLRYRLSLEKEGKEFVGSGRRPALTPEQETELAYVISVLSRIGFSPSRNEIKELVKEFVISQNLPNPFTNDKPGKA